MKKGIVLPSIVLLVACLAALPVAARGSREPSPTPTPAPAPAVPAYIDVPTWYTQTAPWPCTLVPLQPPSIERYPNPMVWSQYYQGIRIAGVYGSPHDPFTGFPPIMYAYPRVLFTF